MSLSAWANSGGSLLPEIQTDKVPGGQIYAGQDEYPARDGPRCAFDSREGVERPADPLSTEDEEHGEGDHR